ncbi:hypothetical protein bsdE14_33390 [Clostridium omnivorum]|uniref:Uncharacterized protein n=1 Tax=Clostridium omnivorum TaxID=1604902 RepID=A0ABQ5NA12_9CLOT|nr:hypothetical protein bsdE14_33390 [Clostridium sp. E14]
MNVDKGTFLLFVNEVQPIPKVNITAVIEPIKEAFLYLEIITILLFISDFLIIEVVPGILMGEDINLASFNIVFP